MRGPCWVADVDSVPGLSSHSLWHLTTTPRGAIGCDPVSQNRAWVQKRKEDYPRPRLSNKQELLTARPQSLQSVKRRWKKQRLCPFTIYLQIQRWEQLARNLAHTSHSTCAASPTEALPGQPLSQLWEQAESCKPCSKILSPTFTRATELALQYQLQRCQVHGHPESQAESRQVALSAQHPFHGMFLSLSGHIFTAPPTSMAVKIQNWGKCFKLANYLSPQTFGI